MKKGSIRYQEEVALLMTMPGVKKDPAAVIIAEIGVDMKKFLTSKHLASWAGLSPGNQVSAGKRKSTRTVKGNPHIKSALCEAAWAISRSRNKRLSVIYWSLSARRGKKKALVAIGHRMLTIVYHMLKDKEPYHELTVN